MASCSEALAQYLPAWLSGRQVAAVDVLAHAQQSMAGLSGVNNKQTGDSGAKRQAAL